MLQTNFLSGGGSKGDGRNLVLGSGVAYTNKEYLIHEYDLTEDLELNQTYTGTIWGNLGEGKMYFGLYIGGARAPLGRLYKTGDGVYSAVCNFEKNGNYKPTDEELKSRKLHVYTVSSATEVESTIHHISLERGIVTDPLWTPAPEDIATHTDVEQAVGSENLLRAVNEPMTLGDGSWANGSWRSASSGKGTRTQIDITDCPNPLIKKGWRNDASGLSDTIDVAQNGISVEYERSYTLSCYARGTGTIRLQFGNSEYRALLAPLSSNWKKYTFAYTFSKEDAAAVGGVTNAFFGARGGSIVELCGMKMEKNIIHDPVFALPPIDYIFHALDPIPEAHRNNFRGKNLGTVFTDAQKAAIKAGTFDDLWVGDYWVINNHTWRVVDINYWYNKGDTACTTPHIVVMPDAPLYTHNMNEGITTDKGYQGSLMRTEGLAQAKEIINTDFGEDYVLNHRVYLTNATASGRASGGSWYDSAVELANESMMYGCLVFSAVNNGAGVPYLYTTETTQLALFRLVPRFINTSRQWFWLRDIVSGIDFAGVGETGLATYLGASDERGVRPVFGITGGAVASDESDADLEMTELSGKGGEPL